MYFIRLLLVVIWVLQESIPLLLSACAISRISKTHPVEFLLQHMGNHLKAVITLSGNIAKCLGCIITWYRKPEHDFWWQLYRWLIGHCKERSKLKMAENSAYTQAFVQYYERIFHHDILISALSTLGWLYGFITHGKIGCPESPITNSAVTL